MGLPVVTVASGGLPIVESTIGGTPVTEASNGYGLPVTKVVGKPGLPIVFETIGVGGGTLAPPLDAVASVTGAWSFSRNMLTSFGAGTRYTKSGTSIISVTDQTGNGRHFTDGANPPQRPIEVTAFPTNRLCADFDGVTYSLVGPILSSFITVSSGAMVISLIVETATLNNAQPYLDHPILQDNGSNGIGLVVAVGGAFYAGNWDGTRQTLGPVAGSIGVPCVLMWRHHGGNLYLSVNGGTEVSTPSGNSSLAQALRMGWNSPSRLADMKVAEVFTTSDGSQTAALAAAIANMKTYCGA